MLSQMTYPDWTRPVDWQQSAAVVGLMCLITAMQPGTGGLTTVDYYKERGSLGYPFVPLYGAYDHVTGLLDARTPADDIAHIRSFLRPAMADLANALGVSRQAVYDWQAGKPIAALNATKLADLARAADILAAEGLTASAQLIRRPVEAGKNLLDIVRDGGSAEEAATLLASIIKDELCQREQLTRRLVSRGRSAFACDDLGSPVMDERV